MINYYMNVYMLMNYDMKCLCLNYYDDFMTLQLNDVYL